MGNRNHVRHTSFAGCRGQLFLGGGVGRGYEHRYFVRCLQEALRALTHALPLIFNILLQATVRLPIIGGRYKFLTPQLPINRICTFSKQVGERTGHPTISNTLCMQYYGVIDLSYF